MNPLQMPPVRSGVYQVDSQQVATVDIRGADTSGYYLEVIWADKTGTLEGPYATIWEARVAAYELLGIPHHCQKAIQW